MQDGIQRQTIELDRIKNHHVLIVAKLSELESIFQNRLIIIPSQPIPKSLTRIGGVMLLDMQWFAEHF